jgi:hypothetical protein
MLYKFKYQAGSRTAAATECTSRKNHANQPARRIVNGQSAGVPLAARTPSFDNIPAPVASHSRTVMPSRPIPVQRKSD